MKNKLKKIQKNISINFLAIKSSIVSLFSSGPGYQKLKENKNKVYIGILSSVLVVSLAVVMLPLFKVEAFDKIGGAGSKDNPYLISSLDALNEFADYVSSGKSKGKYNEYFELTCDIKGFNKIIGTYDNYFDGQFNGNGYEIELNIDKTGQSYTEQDHVGLFARIAYNATVKNLGVAGTIKGGRFVGGIAGFSSGTIENCYNTATISGDVVVGGIVGQSAAGSDTKILLKNCYNSGNITAGSQVGGMVGFFAEGGVISKCINSGTITNNGSAWSPYYAGGIAGWTSTGANKNKFTISECYNLGSIISGSTYNGGIIGRTCKETTIEKCFNSGSLANATGNYTGAIIGYNDSATVKDCSYVEKSCDLAIGNGGSGGVTSVGGGLGTWVKTDVFAEDGPIQQLNSWAQTAGYQSWTGSTESPALVAKVNVYFVNQTIYGEQDYITVSMTDNQVYGGTLETQSANFSEKDINYYVKEWRKDQTDANTAVSSNTTVGRAWHALYAYWEERNAEPANITQQPEAGDRTPMYGEGTSIGVNYEIPENHTFSKITWYQDNIKVKESTDESDKYYDVTDDTSAGEHTYYCVIETKRIEKTTTVTSNTATINVQKKEINENEVTITNPTYNGTVQKPAVKVDGINEADFTVEYKEADQITAVTADAGDKYAIITFTNPNYKGNAEDGKIYKDYKVAPLDLSNPGEGKTIKLTLAGGKEVTKDDVTYKGYSFEGGTNITPNVEKVELFDASDPDNPIDITLNSKNEHNYKCEYEASCAAISENPYTVKIVPNTDASVINFTNEATEKYMVVSPYIDETLEVTLEQNTYTYDGTEHHPKITSARVGGVEIYDNLSIGKSETDWVNEIDVPAKALANPKLPTAYFWVTDTNSEYYGMYVWATFEIEPKNINDTSVGNPTFNEEECTYNGTQLIPTFTLNDTAIEELELETDYEISGYGTNVDVKDGGKIYINGIGNYTGSRTLNFAIKPKSIIEKVTIQLTSSGKIIYDGTRKTPEVIVTDTSVPQERQLLQYDIDYTVDYGENINAGNGAGSAKIKGKGNYAENTEQNITFTIEKADNPISDITYGTTSNNHQKVYLGDLGSINLKYDGNKTNNGHDNFNIYYDQEGKNKVDTTFDFLDVGTYYFSFEIAGDNNYNAYKSDYLILEVIPLNLDTDYNITIIPSPETFTYNGNEQTPSFTVTYAPKVQGPGLNGGTIDSKEYEIGYDGDKISAGTQDVTIKFPEDSNFYNTSSKQSSYEITPKSIASVTIEEIAPQKHTGSAIEPALTVKDGNTTLQKYDASTVTGDYEPKYNNNINPGKATVSIEGKGNYTGTSAEKYFYIYDNTPNIKVELDYDSVEYIHDTPQKAVVKSVYYNEETLLKEGTDYTVKYDDTYDYTNVGSYPVIVNLMGVYQGSVTEFFEITPKKLGDASETGEQANIEIEDVDYDGTSYMGRWKPSSVSYNNVNLNDGVDYNIDYASGADYTNVRQNVGDDPEDKNVIITFKGNYTGTQTATFHINQIDNELSVTGDTTCEYGSVPFPTITNPSGGTLTYQWYYRTDDTKEYEPLEGTYVENVGQYKLIVTSAETINYKEATSEPFEFTITPKDISSSATVTIDDSNAIYLGGAPVTTIGIDIKDGEIPLNYGTDYQVKAFNNNTVAGTASIEIQFIGNYKNTVTKEFTVHKLDFTAQRDKITVTLDQDEFIHDDGNPRTPIVTKIEYNPTGDKSYNIPLDGNIDTLTYDNNDRVGIATVHIPGINNCEGRYDKNFTIGSHDVSGATITIMNPEDLIYNGGELKPEVTITNPEVARENYDLTYSNNINAGKNTAVVYVTYKNGYIGSKPQTFTILPKELGDDADIQADYDEISQTYTGAPITPDYNSLQLSVKINDEKTDILRDGIDYEIVEGSYKNNTSASEDTTEPNEKPQFQVKFNGNYNYTGTQTIYFEIQKAENEVTVECPDITYGSPLVPGIECTSDEWETATYYYKSTTDDSLFKELTKGIILNAGEYEIYAIVAETSNYKEARSNTITVTIDKAENPITVSIDGADPNTPVHIKYGTEWLPTIDGNVDPGSTVTCYYAPADADSYSYTEEQPTEVGSYKVVARSSETTNYKASQSDPAYFDIIRTENKLVISCEDITFEETPSPKAEENVSGGEVTFEYKLKGADDSTYTTTVPTEAGEYTVRGTSAQTISYEACTSEPVDFKINPKNIGNLIEIEVSDVVYTGNELKPTVEVTYNGSKLTEGTHYRIGYYNNVSAGTGTVTVTLIGNYEGENTKDFQISQLDLSDRAEASLEYTETTFTGLAMIPKVTVTYDNINLVYGKDYTLAYLDNTSAGKATVKVSYMGNYKGQTVKNFEILPLDISNKAEILLDYTNTIYTGLGFSPSVTILYNGQKLIEGKDYKLSYDNNIFAQKGKVTITYIGDYTGTTVQSYKIMSQSSDTYSEDNKYAPPYDNGSDSIYRYGSATDNSSRENQSFETDSASEKNQASSSLDKSDTVSSDVSSDVSQNDAEDSDSTQMKYIGFWLILSLIVLIAIIIIVVYIRRRIKDRDQ